MGGSHRYLLSVKEICGLQYSLSCAADPLMAFNFDTTAPIDLGDDLARHTYHNCNIIAFVMCVNRVKLYLLKLYTTKVFNKT